MIIRELWSQTDEASLRSFVKAVFLEDLARALLAIEGASGGAAEAARSTLDGWARQLRARLDEGATPNEQAAAAEALLGGELGLRPDDGSRPQGALLTEVLAARAGRPTLLAAIWVEVASRAGLEATTLGLAGRILVRLGGVHGVLVDPAAGGEAVIAAQLIASGQGLPSAPVTIAPSDLLAGTLNFLVNTHHRRGELIEVFRAASFVCALRPEVPNACLQKAMVAEQLGAFGWADEAYRHVAERFPGTQESQVAAIKLHDSLTRGPQLRQ